MEFRYHISDFFHRSARNDGMPPDRGEWPAEWTRVYFKSYPRLPRLDLTPYLGELAQCMLADALRKRRSARDFSGVPFTLERISNLLYYAAGIQDVAEHRRKHDWDSSRRFYPSAGSRYPLEIYPLVLRGDGELKGGLYHYDVKDHALEVLWEKDFLKDKTLEGAFVHPHMLDASVILFMTAVFWRTQMKYQEEGYRFVLQEAGHLGQNLYLVSEALGLGCSAIGGYTDTDRIERLLDVDGVTESSVYAFAIGPKTRE